MLVKYFCAFHLKWMTASAYEASGCWAGTMRRGMQAYCECRTDEAAGYLSAAIEVALLHKGRPKSGFFEAVHLIKPAGLLVSAYR